MGGAQRNPSACSALVKVVVIPGLNLGSPRLFRVRLWIDFCAQVSPAIFFVDMHHIHRCLWGVEREGKDTGTVKAASAPADEDAPLVKRCLGGDTAAFEVLVERHQKRMYTTALRMLDDAADAADVVQEAFLAAYRSLSGFRYQARFATWLTSIVMNLSRNRLKQRDARLRREIGSLNAPADCGGVKEQACGCPPADARLECSEVRERVQRCIAGLEDDQREVMILRDIHEYSYEEIGGMLDLPDGTVKSRLFRARLALKDCLKRLLGERL